MHRRHEALRESIKERKLLLPLCWLARGQTHDNREWSRKTGLFVHSGDNQQTVENPDLVHSHLYHAPNRMKEERKVLGFWLFVA